VGYPGIFGQLAARSPHPEKAATEALAGKPNVTLPPLKATARTVAVRVRENKGGRARTRARTSAATMALASSTRPLIDSVGDSCSSTGGPGQGAVTAVS
jgi:hypothetical protein